MSFYNEHLLPQIINQVMKGPDFSKQRPSVVAQARGRVLEVGIGSGHNLPLYGPNATAVVGIDPSAKLLELAKNQNNPRDLDVDFILATAEDLPFASASFDTVVSTWTLCSIPNLNAALHEVRRVLKPEGQFFYIEHGLAPSRWHQKLQQTLTPVWKRFSGGCHLDRPIASLISDAGFVLTTDSQYYGSGLRPLSYTYFGTAVPLSPK